VPIRPACGQLIGGALLGYMTVTVNWADSVATVAVHGEPGHITYSQLRDRLAWVIENRPQRLVLELGGMADRFGGRIITIIAAARQQLPPGSAAVALRVARSGAGGIGGGGRRVWHRPLYDL
jgi:hypothetical protein